MSQTHSLGALPKTPPVNSPQRSDCPSTTGQSSLQNRDSISNSNQPDIVEKRRRPKRKWNAVKKREMKNIRDKQMADENLGIVAVALLSLKSINRELQTHQKAPPVRTKTFHPPNASASAENRAHPHPKQDVSVKRPSSDDTEVQQLPALFNNCIITRLNPLQKFLCDQNLIAVLKKRSVKHPKAEFVCMLCSYYCDTLTVVEKHISDRRHRDAIKEHSEETTIANMPEPSLSQLVCLTQLVLRNSQLYGVTDEDRARRQGIAAQVHTLVSQALPDCAVRLYGSSLTGMALKDSDVNLDLVFTSELAPSKMLLAVNDLIAANERFRVVECNLNADLPAVIFFDVATKLKCVMCLNNHNAYETSKLLAHYESIDKRVKPLAVMFRAWAALCQIDQVDLGAWPPYAFSLLLVYYLQQMENPVLPVLHDLDQRPNPEDKPEFYLDPSELSGVWECKNSMPLGQLWVGLLRFYVRDFAMSARVVCIQQLIPLKRSLKKWTGRKLAIEDPFLSKRNVSRTIVNMITFDFIMSCFRTTYKYYAIPQSAAGAVFGSIQKSQDPREYGPEYEQILKLNMDKLEYIVKHDPCYSANGEPVNGKCQNYSELVVTPQIASLMIDKFNGRNLVYQWKQNKFWPHGQEMPIVCCMCRRDGHRTDDCPDEELPPIEPLPPMTDTFSLYLSQICVETHHVLSPNEEEINDRQMIVADIEEFLIQSHPHAQLELFGSSCNGFGLHKSDMDICLTFANNQTGKLLNFAHIIEEILVKLRKCKLLSNLIAITTAKVPILKFVHSSTKLEGDISVYNTLGQRNTKMLRAYADIDPRVTMLGFMIKKLAKLCDICDASRGSLSSYAYVLMVIYFLQQCDPPVLPVLQQLHKPHIEPAPIMIEGCNTYFYGDVPSLRRVWPDYGRNKTPVGLLWLQLLRFYTEEFDYKSNVIAIKQKEILPRFEKLWNTKSIAIEDPFDLTHNLGAGLSRKMHMFILKALIKVRTHFGTPKNLPEVSLESYFFDKSCIVEGSPPNDRGCRVCKKIGHLAKDCPQKMGKPEGARPRGQGSKQRGGGGGGNGNQFPSGLLPEPRRFNTGPNGHPHSMYLGYQNGYTPPHLGNYPRERFDSRYVQSQAAQEVSRLEMMRQSSMLTSKYHLDSRNNW